MVLFLGLFAGLLQACGYIAYIWKSLKDEIDPNPSTWLMFSYGTAILTMLEWDRDARWEVLILPVTCAVMSLAIAFLCWKKGTLKWPTSWIDRSAFIADLLLTVAYVLVSIAATSDLISDQEREVLIISFLVLSNASTVVSFVPLMRTASEDEHPLPWAIWSGAYATLAVVTAISSGWDELILYPISNAILHGLVAVLAIPRGRCLLARS